MFGQNDKYIFFSFWKNRKTNKKIDGTLKAIAIFKAQKIYTLNKLLIKEFILFSNISIKLRSVIFKNSVFLYDTLYIYVIFKYFEI